MTKKEAFEEENMWRRAGKEGAKSEASTRRPQAPYFGHFPKQYTRRSISVCVLSKELTYETAYKKTQYDQRLFPCQAYAHALTRARSPHLQHHFCTRPSHQGPQ